MENKKSLPLFFKGMEKIKGRLSFFNPKWKSWSLEPG